MIKRPYVWLALAVLAVYGRTVFFGWTYLDDNALILEDRAFLGDWRNVLELFRRDAFHTASGPTAYYRPIFNLSIFLDARWTGLSAAGYHFTNVAIHAAACGLLYRMLLALAFTAEASFFGALAFAVHPALAQAVCWIPARNDALLGAFTFAGFTAFLRWLETGVGRHLIGLLVFFALALFTKETAIALPAACVLYAAFDPARARARRWNVALLGFGLVVAAWYALRAAALRDPLRLPWSDLLLSLWAGKTAVLQYLGKALLPFELSVLPTVRDTGLLPGVLALAGLAAALILKPPRRLAAFGLAWFALFLLPTLILRSTTFDLTMEQRLYVPLAGLLVAALSWGWKGGARRWAPLALLAALAFRHSGNFEDRRVFWESAARTSPNLPLAHRNLGAIRYMDGDLDAAAAEFGAALRLNPVEPMAHNNLGLVYMRQGRLAQAEAAFRRELELYPNYANALFNLGLLYSKTGHEPEAGGLWRRVLELEPGHADAARELAALGAKAR